MNEDTFKGKWNQMKGSAQKKWGELTNDELDKIEGDSTRLSGIIQERYGRSKEEADKEIKQWQESV